MLHRHVKPHADPACPAAREAPATAPSSTTNLAVVQGVVRLPEPQGRLRPCVPPSSACTPGPFGCCPPLPAAALKRHDCCPRCMICFASFAPRTLRLSCPPVPAGMELSVVWATSWEEVSAVCTSFCRFQLVDEERTGFITIAMVKQKMEGDHSCLQQTCFRHHL